MLEDKSLQAGLAPTVLFAFSDYSQSNSLKQTKSLIKKESLPLLTLSLQYLELSVCSLIVLNSGNFDACLPGWFAELCSLECVLELMKPSFPFLQSAGFMLLSLSQI